MPLTRNDPMPAFNCLTTGNQTLDSKDLAGKQVIIYFYPKDCTPGCTQQGEDFRDHYTEFAASNTVIYGVSRDKLALHEKFKAEHQFPFELIADQNEELCKLFGVIHEKNMYGKKVKGIQRSTFLFDEKSILRQEWRAVKVPEHVKAVLTAAQALAN